MLIQALPGSGKTYFQAHAKDVVYDGDDFTDGERSFAPYDECKGSLDHHFTDSRWFFDIDKVPDIVFVIDFDTWIANIHESRSDLLDLFGDEKLAEWHADYIKCFVDMKSTRTPINIVRSVNVIVGKEGELLTDALERSGLLNETTSDPESAVETISDDDALYRA